MVGTGDGKPGRYTRYDGELILAHRGTDFHNDRVSFISILLDVGGDGDEELEKLIVGWETFQERQYRRCEVSFVESSCSLRKNRRLGGIRDEGDFKVELQEKLAQLLDLDTLMDEDEDDDDAMYLWAEHELFKGGSDYENLDDDLEVEEHQLEDNLEGDSPRVERTLQSKNHRRTAEDYLRPYRLPKNTGTEVSVKKMNCYETTCLE